MLSVVVYTLCAVASSACAWMLLRSYRRSHTQLLLWCGLCFVGLTLNNVFLIIDLVLVQSIDFSMIRAALGLGGLAIVLYGLIWETV